MHAIFLKLLIGLLEIFRKRGLAKEFAILPQSIVIKATMLLIVCMELTSIKIFYGTLWNSSLSIYVRQSCKHGGSFSFSFKVILPDQVGWGNLLRFKSDEMSAS